MDPGPPSQGPSAGLALTSRGPGSDLAATGGIPVLAAGRESPARAGSNSPLTCCFAARSMRGTREVHGLWYARANSGQLRLGAWRCAGLRGTRDTWCPGGGRDIACLGNEILVCMMSSHRPRDFAALIHGTERRPGAWSATMQLPRMPRTNVGTAVRGRRRSKATAGGGPALGAPESNAGDDFHFWWAATRALELIKPGAESTVVTVEGLSRVDDPDDEYEAVDVGVYTGGDDLGSASAVVLSQLKHSTRHPGKAWTASRLCEQRTRRGRDGSVVSARSVIADLAGVYALLLAGHSREELLRKVRISLVSNQPGDPLLRAGVDAAAAWARSRPAGAGKLALLRALAGQHAEVVGRLADAIGSRLRSGEFCDFLTVLDLSQTGALGRAALARGVVAGTAELAPGRGPDSARRLFDLVRREALPESSRAGIRASDVLAELGVADPADLYPAPARLPVLDDPLPAPGARAIADAVLAHPGAAVVAHGPAGAGKTTALRQLGAYLPPGSVVAVFDCYGGGEYLSSGEERHTAQRFVTQTVNDLAQRCGTPLLIHPPAVEEDLWRRLRRTLEGAVNMLDPEGVLVLAVDAADNAVFAAGERGDRGFVPGLVGLRLPPRVTVVLTARSHRAGSLGVPGADRVEIQPFDAATSAAHLRRYRADASDADTAEFHTRTDGNPRAQYYALTRAAEDGWDMPALLEACARTPDTLFEKIVDSGLEVSGADAGGRRWLALMLALARPVSTSTLAAALGVDPAAVVAFAHGLAPGVSVAGEAIQFRDEDFETYVRSRVDPSDVAEAHDRLADMFLAGRARDADAAAYVADHLFAANRLDEVLQLVVDEDWPEAIPDGFRRAQVQGRRLDLAARAAAVTGSASSAVRVAVRACDTASRLDTLSSLVESRLDLVARYADVDLLRGYALRQSLRNGWLAPVHMRLAAALARDPARHAAARTELDRAEAWLRRWVTSPREETRGWDMDPGDAACAAEARYRLGGLDAAIAELDKWRPSDFATAVAAALAARVAAEEGPGPVRDALRAHGVSAAAQAPFLAYAASAIAVPDRGWVDEVLAALLAADPGRERPWHSRLIDVAARHGDRESAVALARHWARPLPSHRWGFSSGDADGVAALRARAVAAALSGTGIDLDDLVPLSLRPRNQEPDEAGASRGLADDSRGHERREWAEIAGPLLAAALLAARAAVGDAGTDEVAAFAAGGLAGRTEKSGHRWFTFDSSYRAWAALVADAALDVAAGPKVVDQLAEAAPALLRDGAPALWLDLAAGLARRGAHPDRAVDLCRQAAARARTDGYPAADRLDLLARAAEIAGGVAPEIGRQLFDQAVDAATGINDGAARLLAVHADLASRAAIGAADRPVVAARLIRAAEAVAPHVTDSDVIPYEAVAGAAGRLDAGVALAAVSRWDDEDRIRLARTLPAALLGAVDGGGVPAAHALVLDHLVEDDLPRLQYLLAVIDRLREGAAGIAAARVALNRSAAWIRCDVPARAQPALAGRLLDWAAERGLDGHIRAAMDPVVQLACDETDRAERWRGADPPAEAQALLAEPLRRGWTTLADDATLLAEASVSGDQIRGFVAAVASTAPAGQRVNALTAIADLPDRVGVAITLPVLAQCLAQWRDWPGVTDWAAAALPRLLTRHLPSLFWWQDTGPLVEQLRAFASDDDIRRAVLTALPGARPRLTAYDWQNIASLLGRLCGPGDSAAALTALLTDRLPGAGDAAGAGAAVTDPAGPLPLLLWSAFGHPRREIRWRAAHAARDLLSRADLPAATGLAAGLVGCLDRTDAGPYRDPGLHFYRLSAAAALLAALARVAADKPAVLAAQLPALARAAASRDLPHAQIRELARRTALAVAGPGAGGGDDLRLANQPAACSVDRKQHHHGDGRQISEDRRYDFDQMDTLPYWYAPLARVFDLPVDAVAERAERWILDEWGLAKDDWWSDARELRDQRSYQRMSAGHGSIPPEENLRLYLEYHAMLTAAGELVDSRRPVRVDSWDDPGDPWRDWLDRHMPVSADIWLADLRSPVPAEPELFGHLSPLDEWDTPADDEYDHALGLTDGRLPDPVLIAGHTSVQRPGAYGDTSIVSALVAPAHASDLQRALAAAADPTDWKLPDEGEEEFEVDHGPYVLRGWLADPRDFRDTLDEHDPYARGLRPGLAMPGRRFRDAAGAGLDATGLRLLGPGGAVLARADQWADPDTSDTNAVTSSGSRLHVDRGTLLRYLADTGMTLVVEVQIGRHRRDAGIDGYRPPRSRIYLIDALGPVAGS